MEKSAIFNLEFDKDKFVTAIEEAIVSSKKFDDTMQNLSQSANDISFTKPISEMHKFQENFKESFKSIKSNMSLSSEQVNKSVDNILKSESKIKTFLNELKKDLKNATSPEEFSNLSKAISNTETALKKLKSADKPFDSFGITKENIQQQKRAIADLESSIKKLYKDIDSTAPGLVQAGMVREVRELERELESETKALNDMKEALSSSSESVNEMSQQTKSAKARLRELKNELLELENAGQDNTERFRELTIEAAALTDQIGDQAEQIRVLASDTFALDAGIDAVKQLAGAWQLAEGTLQLFGVSTEDAQEQMQKLIAVQSVLNGLQEVENFLRGQGPAITAAKVGWDKAMAATTALVATVTGEATVATRAFSTALLATGIGAFVVALGLLIANWEDVEEAISGVTDEMKLYEEANKNTASEVANANKEVLQQKALFKSARDGVISKEKALKSYNDTFGSTLGVAKSYNEAERIFNSKTKDYLEAVRLRARAQEFFKISAQKSAEAQLEGQKSISLGEKFVGAFTALEGDAYNKRAELYKKGNILQGLTYGIEAAARQNRNEDIKQKNKEAKTAYDLGLKDYEEYLKKNVDLENDNDKKDKEVKEKAKAEKKQVENIYQELLDGFKKDLDAINDADLKGLTAINKKAEQNYQDRIKKIDEGLKEGKLTKKQAGTLREKVGLIQKAELETEIKKFQEERAKVLEDINRQQQELDNELAQQKIENIQNEYEREVKFIEYQESIRLQAIENARKDSIDKLNDIKKEEFLNEEEYLKRVKALNDTYDGQIIQGKLNTNKQLQDANIKRLEGERELYTQHLDTLKSFLDYQEAIEVKQATDRFNAGTISAEKLNAEIFSINKKYADQNKQNRIKQIDDEIDYLNKELEANKENAKKVEEILKRIYDLKRELIEDAIKEKDDIPFEDTLVGRIFGWDPEDKSKNGGLAKIKAVQNLVKQTIQTSIDLLKEQARLEVEAYDRAINLQKGRVDEARKIADAGNAEYLQQEKDKLNELEAKREASARRQLEIDQAVQASQILVAVAGAAAQIAKGGTVGVITGLTAVIAAIGSGVTLVNQMKSNAPKFFDGTEYVERGNNPDGRDTIPAMVNIGERIVPTNINKQLMGIPNKDLPRLVSGELFYNNMISVSDRDMPKRDDSSKLEKRLQNLEVIQSEQLEYLKALSVNVTMDESGFAASVETMIGNKRKKFDA